AHDNLWIRATRLLRIFFFHVTTTTKIYTLSLHDALPISARQLEGEMRDLPGVALGDHLYCILAAFGGIKFCPQDPAVQMKVITEDRKSTRLNSSHVAISYAVFCLKKKKKRP